MMNKNNFLCAILGIFLVVSCTSTAHKGVLESEQSQVRMRAIQTRSFDTADKKMIMKSVIATLQDLSFVIDQADYDIGTIKATKLNGYNLVMSVSVRPQNIKQIMVRASARYNDTIVEDAKPYQDFFTALSKGIFLDANMVE